MKIQRNERCSCQSGKKYKKCCLLTLEVEIFQPSKPLLKNIKFVTEMSPEIDDECDRALEKIGNGDLAGGKKIADFLYYKYPSYHSVNFLQGVCHIKEESFAQAIVHFEKAIHLFPYFTEAYFNLAGLYLKNIEIPKAVDCYKKIIEIEGEHGDLGESAREELIKLEEMTQKFDGCTLEKYVEAHELFDQAFTCLNEKKYRIAISLFQKVLTITPDHVQSYGNMGLAYSGLGQNKMAMECFDKAIALDFNYMPAHVNRKVIGQLDEGEGLEDPIRKIEYYKDGLI